MKRTLKALSTAVIYSALLFSGLQARSNCGNFSASITNLPALPDQGYQVNALNSAGKITGYFFNDSFIAEAFLFDSGNLSDLGTLGGSVSQGRGINRAGTVVGDATTAVGDTHAVLFDGNAASDLGTLGGSYSTAGAINEIGQVIGLSYTAGDLTFEGFFYFNGVMSRIGTFGGSFSGPFALNNSGVVVGESNDGDGNYLAFFYFNGVMTPLGTLGGQYSAAFSINEAGVIVGESSLANGDIHPFVYSAGVMKDLGSLGGSYAGADYINQSNQIAGQAQIADGSYHAFFYENGTMTDLGTLGGPNIYPNAMNDLGQVVGQADTASGGSHAFLWQKGSLVDLNTLLPTNSGWELTSAQFINNSGRIVGTGTLNGTDQTFIMDAQLGNNAPVAVAGSDQTVECGTLVTLDGSNSSDPDGDSLSFEWTCAGLVLGTNSTLSGYFGLGTNVVTLKVSDPCGANSSAPVTVTVNDTVAPQLTVPPSITLVASSNCDAAIPDLSTYIQGSDNCSPASALRMLQQPSAGTVVGAGAHPVQVSLSDEAGNVATATVVVTVVDRTAPVIQSVSVSPNTISPPNNKMVPVSVSISATDNCDPAPVSKITSITCNEAVQNGQMVVTGPLTANLAATRNGAGNGRVYTLTIQCTDNSGNSSQTTVTVTVPQGNGKK